MKKLSIAVVMCLAFSSVALADTAALWKKHCKSCHGATGKADTKKGREEKVRDMTTAQWQEEYSDAKIKEIIAEGSPDNDKMKPFKDKLKPAEIDAMVPFIRAFKK